MAELIVFTFLGGLLLLSGMEDAQPWMLLAWLGLFWLSLLVLLYSSVPRYRYFYLHHEGTIVEAKSVRGNHKKALHALRRNSPMHSPRSGPDLGTHGSTASRNSQ